MSAGRRRRGRPVGTGHPVGTRLSDASMRRVFDALQSLAVKHGSKAAAARIVGCSREAVRLILDKGSGVAPDLARRILSAAGESSDVEHRPTALERLRADREAKRTRRREWRAEKEQARAQLAEEQKRKRARVLEAAKERLEAAEMRRSEVRLAMGPPVSSRSPLDSLAAVVSALLVRHTVDPVAELDTGRERTFAHRVERHVLAGLLDKYGAPNAVAMAVRGRPVGSTLQRTFARHKGDLGPLSQDLAREVQELLDDKRSAWAALLDALDDGEERAAE
jgi:sRNA-binding protein